MAGRIPEHILEDILSRVDIVEVISGYIPLKKAGSNFRALCPFHHEKTPSFMISPARQIYHCFGCGAGGNVFGFLMKYERLEFPEAVEMLAKKAGIALPAFEKQDQKAAGVVTELYTVTSGGNLTDIHLGQIAKIQALPCDGENSGSGLLDKWDGCSSSSG
jgi:DNA primase catalytic core